MKLATAAEMKKLDRLAMEKAKIPSLILMENAGAGAARLIDELYGEEAIAGVILLCGPGNNGGDGFVIARHLHNMGYPVTSWLLGAKDKLKGDARTNFVIAQAMELEINELKREDDLDELDVALESAGLVVDALFGAGLDRPIDGLAADVVAMLAESIAPVVAIDLPSGLSADTGRPLGPVVQADLTITFGLRKLGQFLLPGADLCGRVELVDISIPSMLPQIVEIKQNLTDPFDIMPLLIPREQDTHKGDYGRVLLIGGSKGMSGAPIMAAQAASRCGAGLVTVAVPEPLLPVMENGLLEELKAGLPADANGLLTADALDVALALARNMTVIALGPGLGRSPGVTTFVRGLVEKTDLPLVIDADGLNAIAGALHLLPRPDRQVILTPHPGEAARLLNKSAEEIQNDRVGAARELAKRTGAIVALKGAHTVIAEPEGEVWINPTGNPGMAKGGMGDVLTGMIVGSIADGVPPLLAAISSVYLHGKAGDLARDDLGERAVTAGEVLQRLPRALDEIERSFRGEQTEGEHD